jgi:uncharacterized protein
LKVSGQTPQTQALVKLPASGQAAVALGVLLAGLAATAPSTLSAQPGTPAIPPAPTRWVTDEVGFLSPGTRADLDGRLESYQRSSGHQVIVWIGRTLPNQVLEEWAARTFAAWAVGRRGLDDGVVIFVFAEDRKVRIEVGYGLEDRLTDLRAARIIREEMVPRLRAGDRDGAVTRAVDRVLLAIGGAGGAGAEKQPATGGRRGWVSILFFVIVGGLFLFLFITNPSLAVYLLMSMGSSSSGRRSGWGGGGGGGGFSGGGGRSGGGGASGSW